MLYVLLDTRIMPRNALQRMEKSVEYIAAVTTHYKTKHSRFCGNYSANSGDISVV